MIYDCLASHFGRESGGREVNGYWLRYNLVMSTRKGIVIAEDHTILREGLRALLSSRPKLRILGEAEDGYEALRCVEKLRPDLLLMDLSMPKMNGVETIREIKKRFSETKILV